MSEDISNAGDVVVASQLGTHLTQVVVPIGHDADGAPIPFEIPVPTDAGCCTVPASADGTITKSDTTTYDPPLRAIWATGAGSLVLTLSGSTSTITLTVAAHERVTFLSISKVMAASTATGISGAS